MNDLIDNDLLSIPSEQIFPDSSLDFFQPGTNEIQSGPIEDTFDGLANITNNFLGDVDINIGDDLDIDIGDDGGDRDPITGEVNQANSASKVENNQNLTVNLSQTQNTQIENSKRIAAINNNDLAEISIRDTTITEGDRGQKRARFTVTMDSETDENVKVNFTTVNGTAKAGSDYKRTQGTLNFRPGQTKKIISVPILGDTLDENNEKFQVVLSRPRNAKLGDKRAIANIIDNDNSDDRFPGVDLGKLTPRNELIKRDNIGRGQGNRRDVNDYYNFTVTSENLVTLTLDNLKANADIELYTSDDDIIWRGKKSGRQVEEFTDNLSPGNYTVRVFPKGNARTDYQLGITAQSPYVDDYANPDEAYDFGKVTVDTKRVSNEVGRSYTTRSRDQQDWFNFKVSEESNINIDLRQLRQNIDLILYDDDGRTLLDDSRKTGRQSENINQTLPAGEYYVKVQPKGGARSEYQIAISAEEVGGKSEKFNIGNLSQLETYFNNDRIGFTQSGVRNESDLYFFNLSEEGEVDVTLDQLRANANLRVLDSRGSLMFDSRNPGRNTEEVVEELPAGDYILEVFPQNNAKTSYQLSVEFTPNIIW
ncbi:MAG: pre-peptidase C-terminal domain-containing protein [Cyanobacteriota bacterium]|nr:pre-peptidase C-terminal domain-containing protein [Cyanobacteriota bacterium]